MNYFNKFSKLNVRYKDKVIPVLPLFLAVISLFMITIGGSYAYLTSVEESELVNKITAGTLELTFSSKDNHINLINAVPQEDSVALSENDEYTFNIKNSGNITTYYEMRLDDVCEVGNSVNDEVVDTCIPLEFVRVAFKKGEGEYVIKHMNEEGSVLLDVDTLNGGADSDSFSLKIWLDKYSKYIYNDKDKNIVFASKLSLYAEQRYVQKVGSECLVIEDNKIVDYTCSYNDIEIDSKLVNNVTQTSSNKVYRPKRLENINNYSEVELVDNVVVNTIATEAFKSKGLRSIIINSNITTIEDNAFLDNPGLKDVVMGSVNLSVESFTTGGEIISMKDLNGEFPASCFEVSTSGALNRYNCKSALNIVIPFKDETNTYEVKSIRENTFQNLGIKSIDFSKTVSLQSVYANAFSENDIRIVDFSSNDKLLYIYSYAFDKSNVYSAVLPKNLLTLGAGVFRGDKLSSIIIPEKITKIEDVTFSNNNLEYVQFLGNLEKIGASAFYNNKLKRINIPNTVKTIGGRAFSDNKLENVVIPDSVTNMGIYCFYTNNLDSVYISKNVPVINEFTFAKNKLKNVVIPDSVTEIHQYAFWSNSIKKIELSKNVTTIEKYAFNTNLIEEVMLPDSVVQMGDTAFANNKIKKLVLSNNLSVIPASAFYTNLIEQVNIPDGVTVIGERAFDTNKINELVIPDNVIEIGKYAFRLNNLTKITFSSNISVLPEEVFSNNKLQIVSIPENIVEIANKAFYGNNLSNLVLSEGLVSIGSNAFSANSLKEVIIPSTVTSIGAAAFHKTPTTNPDLVKIVNLTGRAFDWGLIIINNSNDNPFVTGKIEGVSIVNS